MTTPQWVAIDAEAPYHGEHTVGFGVTKQGAVDELRSLLQESLEPSEMDGMEIHLCRIVERLRVDSEIRFVVIEEVTESP